MKCNLLCVLCHGQSVNECDGCIDGYYLDGTTCRKCDDKCETCSITSNNCESCVINITRLGIIDNCMCKDGYLES